MRNRATYPELEKKALWVRQTVARMAVKKGFGHMTTGFSLAELFVALYHGQILRYDSKNPKWPEQDRFILSEGQAAIGLYPVLADVGFFSHKELENFAGKDSILGVHSEPHTPGIQVLTGSLGHGLPIATGRAFAAKNEKSDWLTICLTGDGELCEGSNWEAMVTASTVLMNKLVLVVNRNHQFTIGRTDSRETQLDICLDPVEDKLKAFGFETRVINGHSFEDIFGAFEGVRERTDPRPLAIVAETVKGRGGFMADQRLWHNRTPNNEEVKRLERDLNVNLGESNPKPNYQVEATDQPMKVSSIRDEFFDALFPIFQKNRKNVIVSADDGGPKLFQFADLSGQFVNIGIAEEQMIGMAAGLALEGYRPYALAIASFTSFRCQEFVKLDMCAMNLPIVLIGVGAGLSYSVMGPTHHAIGSLASLKIWPNLTIFQPADAVTGRALANYADSFKQPLYLSFDRKDVPDIYSTEKPPVLDEGLGILRHGDDAFLLATGVTVSPALQVVENLFREHGLRVGVIDIFRLKPLNIELLLGAIRLVNRVVVYEEDYLISGLGSSIAEAFADLGVNKELLRVGLPDSFIFDLGGRDVIWEKNKLDVANVTKRILNWFNK